MLEAAKLLSQPAEAARSAERTGAVGQEASVPAAAPSERAGQARRQAQGAAARDPLQRRVRRARSTVQM